MGAIIRCLALLLCLAAPALARPVTVESEGSGVSRNAAIAAALAGAVEQVSGVAISSNQASISVFAQLVQGEQRETMLAEADQSEIRRQSGGIVRTYRVLSLAPESSGFVARLQVDIEIYESPGNNGETRRRIAVMPFREQGSASGIGGALRDRLNAYLVQSRRFAVVDRAQDAAYQREMAVLASGDAPLTERARMGQVLGADYVLVGSIRPAASHTDRVIGLTGERIQNSSYSASIDYNVIEIATRQIKWGGSARIGSGGGFGPILDQLAARVGDEVTEAIYPMRLIRFADPAALVINQGGVTLRPGLRLRAALQGEEMIDPYTKESLGSTEENIGIVEITRVETKMSYGKLVNGRLPSQPDAVVVLRRQSAGAAAAPPPPRPAPRRDPAAGVVRLPGD
jgi:curli biogenesis system outer membrane secretion channel CsgG